MSQGDYDVVIIGSGAGGGTSAWALSKAGLKVLLLEAGPRYDPFGDYQLHTPEWERPFPNKINPAGRQVFAEMQPLAEKWKHLRSWNHLSGRLNKTDRRQSFGYHHVLGVGGSSLHFTGEAHRMNPASMQMKTRFGVAADWPMSYQDLEPFYAQAEDVVGVAGPAQDSIRPRSNPYPQKTHPKSYASTCLEKGFNKLGLELTNNALAVLSSPTDGRANCNYCGGCLRGCPRRDKGSIDVTYIREAVATGNCEVQSGCTVNRIETGSNDTVKGVHYHDGKDNRFVDAPLLIVACGAVETPRLLLMSQSASAPHGLANESGELGKNFMETLLWTSSGLHPEPMGSHRGLPVDSICWDYNKPDAIPGVIGGCRFGPSQAESDLVGPISYANRVVGGWGRGHRDKMKQTFGHVLSLTGIGESLPNGNTFVSLHPSEKDAFGRPKAYIHSHVDEMATKRIEFMRNTCRDVLAAAGAGEIFEEFSSYDIFSSTHVFGTCRMGSDPETSVVDPWCRSHRWRNLYVVDASVFPSTGGGESPGLSIQALALRAMNKIINSSVEYSTVRNSEYL